MKTRITSRLRSHAAWVTLLWLAAASAAGHAQDGEPERLQCLNNLRQLALAAAMWSTDNADAAPPDILSMREEITTPLVLVCPADPGRRPTRDWTSFTTNNLSYEFLRPSGTNTGPQQVVFRCPFHGLAALLKGTVQEPEPGSVPPPAPRREARANPELEDLKRALQDPDPAVRRAAVERLARGLGEGAQVLLTPRKELLDQYQAAQSTRAGLLAGLVKDEDAQVRVWAVSALSLCGPSARVALPQLLEVLQGTDPDLKVLAVGALGNLGTNAAAAAPALENMLNTSTGPTRLAVAQAFWRITRQARPVLPVLIEALENQGTNNADAWPRALAASTLGAIGPEAGDAVPGLSRLLQANDLPARVAAAAALARIRPDTPGIDEALAAGLRDNGPGARPWLVQGALRDLGARGVPVLVKVAEDASPTVRRTALETLGRMGETAGAAVPLLAAKLQDRDEGVRRAAADALGRMGAASKPAVPALRTALRDTSGSVRAAAAVALVRVDAPALEAIPTLVAAISREPGGETAYITACNAAPEISPAAVPALLEFVKAVPATNASSWDREKTWRLQKGAIDLLGRMGPNARSAIPTLRQMASQPGNESRRDEITEAVRLIESRTMER